LAGGRLSHAAEKVLASEARSEAEPNEGEVRRLRERTPEPD
jgi:hypothetical protein